MENHLITKKHKTFTPFSKPCVIAYGHRTVWWLLTWPSFYF